MQTGGPERSPTAMSLAVFPSVPTPINRIRESIMTATYTFDIFSSLDGYGSHNGDGRLLGQARP